MRFTPRKKSSSNNKVKINYLELPGKSSNIEESKDDSKFRLLFKNG